jgi:hypothetical protein
MIQKRFGWKMGRWINLRLGGATRGKESIIGWEWESEMWIFEAPRW